MVLAIGNGVGSVVCVSAMASDVFISVPTPVVLAPFSAACGLARTTSVRTGCPISWLPAAKRRRCSSKRPSTCLDKFDTSQPPRVGAAPFAASAPRVQPLAVLVGGPYFVMATWFGIPELGCLDAVCHVLNDLNKRPMGPWHLAGIRTFSGIELAFGDDVFSFGADVHVLRHDETDCVSWKRQYEFFHKELSTFNSPCCSEITAVGRCDEVAFASCRLRADIIAATATHDGVYMQMEVLQNSDKLSLAVVDFEGGGSSSVTFSPETGAVLRERKVEEEPRTVEGKYVHLLPAAPPGQGFIGTLGLFLSEGRLAFFRRWASPGEPGGHGFWETTGFCTDLRWALGPRLSVCVAFRDCGRYHVGISSVSRTPPVAPQLCQSSLQDENWMPLVDGDDE